MIHGPVWNSHLRLDIFITWLMSISQSTVVLMIVYISVFSIAHNGTYPFLWDYRTFNKLHSPFSLVIDPRDLHTKAYSFLCWVCLHHYLRNSLALSHLFKSSSCQFNLIFSVDRTLYDQSSLSFSLVLSDFGHCDHVPFIPICFRWFRSWRPHLVLSFSLVISVIEIVSRSFLQFGDFSHSGCIPFFPLIWWFQSLQLRPICFSWF